MPQHSCRWSGTIGGARGAAGWKYGLIELFTHLPESSLVLVAPEVRKHLLEDTAVRQRQHELVVIKHGP
jgi:hypothetical protein